MFIWCDLCGSCHNFYDCCREVLLAYLTQGDDLEVLGSLRVLSTLLQTKGCATNISLCHHGIYSCFLNISHSVELDESMLDGLGILPQRKQHKKLLLVCKILTFWPLSGLFLFVYRFNQITFLLLMPKLLHRVFSHQSQRCYPDIY